MYSQSILIQKLLIALMRLDLETTVCEAWRPSKLSRSRMTFDSARFFLVERNQSHQFLYTYARLYITVLILKVLHQPPTVSQVILFLSYPSCCWPLSCLWILYINHPRCILFSLRSYCPCTSGLRTSCIPLR